MALAHVVRLAEPAGEIVVELRRIRHPEPMDEQSFCVGELRFSLSEIDVLVTW